MTNLDLFNQITLKLEDLVALIGNNSEKILVYKEWNAKDILAHITFWHCYYADNLESLEKRVKFKLLEGKYTDINQNGIESLKSFQTKELVELLLKAHSRIKKVVQNKKVKNMKYKKGSRDYSINELLTSVISHLNHHISDVNRAVNRGF